MMVRRWFLRGLHYFNSAPFLYGFHAWATIFWTAMLIPSWFWWRQNLFWIIVLSWWALVATHWGAWQATRAEIQALKATLEAREGRRDVVQLGDDLETGEL